MSDRYVQVVLHDNAGREDVAFVPARLAVVGKVLVIRAQAGRWKVASTHGSASGEALLAARAAWKRWSEVLR